VPKIRDVPARSVMAKSDVTSVTMLLPS